MIYVEQKNVEEIEFIDLLEKSTRSLIAILDGRKNITSDSFEESVFEQMAANAVGTSFHGTIKRTGRHGFPDITANGYYGVEVKMTSQDHWITLGNSVLESSRPEDVERIYILFGKFGGEKHEIRYRLYQECLAEVGVTHSPRYKIDMNLGFGKSIFDKMGTEYEVLRKEKKPIQKFKDYYRSLLKDGEELWWIDTENEEKPESSIIKPFSRLDKTKQEEFKTRSMILFPEIFDKSNTNKFERVAAYLIAEYNTVSASLRDKFTAKGTYEVNINGKGVKLRRIEYNLYQKAKDIVKELNKIDEETLSHYWKVSNIEKNRVKQWQNFLKKGFTIPASEIFDAGLL